jgi:hypothetical protein
METKKSPDGSIQISGGAGLFSPLRIASPKPAGGVAKRAAANHKADKIDKD